MAGASVVRPTRTVTGERRWKKTKVTVRPSEPRYNSRSEKENRKNLMQVPKNTLCIQTTRD